MSPESERDERIGQGFAVASGETLAAIRINLFAGLDKVAAHSDAGTLHVVGAKGRASAAEAGRVTLGLLVGLDAELAHRANLEVAL